MARFLPPRPDLDHLKNEAKALLKALKERDVSVCPAFRRLKRFANASDAQVLSADVTLAEAQFALAMEYGFASWEELRQVVLDCQPRAGSHEPPQSGALRLPDPPAARPGAHRFPSAYYMALSYCGIDCDYHTVTGDSGLAFILQADSLHTAWGAKRKELDIGFWPVDQWGSLLRLDFLGRIHGRKFHKLFEHEQDYGRGEAEHFRKHFQAAVLKSLWEGCPVLALEGEMWVVTGFDDGTPPLLGQISCSKVAEVKRLGRYPWSVIVLGKRIPTIERAQADAEAISFAVDLYHDRYGPKLPGKSSGKASFALWARLLRDSEGYGSPFYHANVISQLAMYRASAPPYLRQMAERHHQDVAGQLRASADVYEQVSAKLATADISNEIFATVAGREKLADLVDQVAGLDAQAVTYLSQARQAM